ncbi:glycosyltransferase family 2 protein [Oceanithermus sp.]
MAEQTPAATALIPAYNEEGTIADVVQVAVEAGFPVVVADDGSHDGTALRAREAGAEVVELRPNRGKGGAYAAGLERVKTPYVILLDADLTGLRPGHLYELLEPVLRGEADMTVGVFRGGRWLSDFGNRITPQLSGQRALAADKFRSVPDLASSRYDVELKLTRHARKQGWRVRYLPLEGVGQKLKEEKRGFWTGLAHRLRMYVQILRYALKPKA